MLKFTKERPLSVGIVKTEYYANYAEFESKLELWMERLADQGYSLDELEGSNSLKGSIEVTHDELADVLYYNWCTINSSTKERK